MSAANRRELTLQERGAVYLLARAAKHLVKSCYISARPALGWAGIWEPRASEDAKTILDSCAAAIFHGGEPRKAKKRAGVQS